MSHAHCEMCLHGKHYTVEPEQALFIFRWPVSRECYRRTWPSTTISYSVYVVILGVCLRFKPHWMFQIYK